MRSHSPLTLSTSALALTLWATPAAHAGGNVTWPAGSTQNVLSDLILTDTLTVENGVTVMINSGAAIIVQSGGSLIVNGTESDPVLFTGNGAVRWDGIQFQPGSSGHIAHAAVESIVDTGIRIQGCSPMIESCTVRDVTGTALGDAARGIHVLGSGANPVIQRCTIEDIVGRDGAQGSTTGAAGNGSNGSNGSLFSHDGGNGGNGSPGGIGGTGNAGGTALGILVDQGARADISSNLIRDLRGGRGGRGGTGGRGGNGGDGGDGYPELGFLGDGGNGGNGGAGGQGGTGGTGGWAVAIRLSSIPASITVAQNLIQEMLPGQGGLGGTGGRGGDGGDGGRGVNGPFCADTSGGDGGNGGKGGKAGTGGTGGTARAFDTQSGSGSILLVQNTASDLTVGSAGNAGSRGSGGARGFGGPSGSCLADGSNGSNGSLGDVGSNGQVGTRNGASAASAPVAFNNNIITFSGTDSDVMLAASGSGTITAGTNCLFGFASLSSGAVTVQAGNVLADPMFVSASDLHLLPGSPAIDAGSNAAVPATLLTDFDGNERIADGDANSSAIVDIGVYEQQLAIPECPADIDDSGAVNVSDLVALISTWGSCPVPCPPTCAADINSDCAVDVQDLVALITAWGDCPVSN